MKVKGRDRFSFSTIRAQEYPSRRSFGPAWMICLFLDTWTGGQTTVARNFHPPPFSPFHQEQKMIVLEVRNKNSWDPGGRPSGVRKRRGRGKWERSQEGETGRGLLTRGLSCSAIATKLPSPWLNSKLNRLETLHKSVILHALGWLEYDAAVTTL